MIRASVWLVPILAAPVLGLLLADPASTQPLGGTATTESVCNFGMEKGETSRSCQVPIPFGCAVAKFPGTQQPWTNVSKGGHTSCQFDESSTDWKLRITGTCGKCTTSRCSARFSVMFNCSSPGSPAPYKPQRPTR
jgi:hypothetical protein